MTGRTSGLLRSELLKVFTTRLWWGLLIGVVLVSLGFSLLFVLLAEFAPRSAGSGGLDPGDPAVVRQIYAAGLGAGYLFTLSFGIIAMAGEFRHQTFTATVLATPRRLRVVLAKLAVVMLVAGGYGLVAVSAGVLGGAPVLALRHHRTLLDSGETWRALVLGVLAIALWGVVGLGVGTLIRNQVVALLVAVGTAWIAEPLIAFGLTAAGQGGIARFFPSQATSALISPPATGNGVATELLPWWAGALILVGYAVVSGGLGAGLTLRRDVT